TSQSNATQTYYIAASAGGPDPAWRTATGNFSISLSDQGTTGTTDAVREGTDTTATLAIGGSVNGTIDAEPISGDGVTSDNQGGFVDKDWYQVTLQKGHIYSVSGSATSITTGSIAFSLRDKNGTPVNGIYHNEAFQYVEGPSEQFTFDTSGQVNGT